jgi:thiol-disulfide isomerase/thioredoxin
MKFFALPALAFLLAVSALPQQRVTIVNYVQGALAANDFPAAEKGLSQYRAALGATPEYIEALSWLGRAELARRNAPAAEQNAAEVRKLALAELARRNLDAEPHLPLALGASIEVRAQAAAAQGRRDEAVLFLNDELKKWRGTSISSRIQKNLNLLTLEGKPVPVLDVSQWIGSHRALPLSAHRGHPVLLFLWAHWCSDCKNEIAVVRKLMANYGPRGLVVVAPTQHYGYVARGEEAPPAVETKYIGQVFDQYYAGLGAVEIPLSEANFAKFGVSTTPTMVLVDGRGIVRMYNPGNASYEALAARLDAILRASAAPAGRG